MILIALVYSFQKDAQQSPLQVKSRFEAAFKVASTLQKIGSKKVQRASRSISIDEMFSQSRTKDFNCRFESETGRYWVGAGENSPLIMIYDNGFIASFDALYRFPDVKQKELPEIELKGYADQAMRLIAPSMGQDTIEFIRTKSLYSSEERKLADPQIDLEAIRKTNGFPWGPGRWGKVVLVNFTGEVSLAMANRTFSRIEDTPGVMSQDECSHYAATAVLGIKGKECTQTSLIKEGGKFITGNPFLGGQYFSGTARAKKIVDENLGVLAYEYQFGNGDAMVNGGYAVFYDVIVDARTGVPLRILSPMALGAVPGAKSPGWTLPGSSSDITFRSGKSVDRLRSVLIRRVSEVPTIPTSSATMQIGKAYWQVERAGKNLVKVGPSWFKID